MQTVLLEIETLRDQAKAAKRIEFLNTSPTGEVFLFSRHVPTIVMTSS